MNKSDKKLIIFAWIAFGALAIAIILEALPFGVVLKFMPQPNGEPLYKYYSYFDPTPFGYASFSPLITAALTVLLAATSLALLFVKRELPKLRLTLSIVTMIAAAISASPILYGIDYLTVTSVFITLLLITSALFCFFTLNLRKPMQNANETSPTNN